MIDGRIYSSLLLLLIVDDMLTQVIIAKSCSSDSCITPYEMKSALIHLAKTITSEAITYIENN